MGKIKCAVVGPGNIGADLIEKIRKRSKNLEIGMVVGLYVEIADIAIGTLLGNVDEPLVVESAVVDNGEQDVAVTDNIGDFITVCISDFHMFSIVAEQYAVDSQCAAVVAVIVVSPFNQLFYERLLQSIQITRRDAVLAA